MAKTFTKGDQKRTAHTPADEVRLKFDGWQEQKPAKSDPKPASK